MGVAQRGRELGARDRAARPRRRPAGASTAPFAAQLFSANPLNNKDVGSYSAPAFGDLDGDGDLDLISGEQNGLAYYFENTGTAASALFVQRAGAANPFDAQVVGLASTPALADLDADGDLDALFGNADGQLLYFENTGGATTPAFIAQAGAANPLDGVDVGSDAVPAFGDLDGDGDLDLLAGDADGLFHYFENTGGATAPAFVEQSGAENPLAGEDVGLAAAPALGDVDGDGDVDVLSSEFAGGTFLYYENTGTATSPAFTARTGVANPMNGLSVTSYPTTATLGDLDADGDSDLISGARNGTFAFFANRTGRAIPRTGAQNPLDSHEVGSHSAPAWGDLDGDGDLDLVSGIQDGAFAYFENTGTRTSPAFVARTGSANPLDGQNVADFVSRPSLADLDGDGDLDLVAGNSDGIFHYFENTGAASSPGFAHRTGSANPLDGQAVVLRAAPSLGDLDGDGDLDVVSGRLGGVFSYFENTGSAPSPAFVERTGAANPLDGKNVGGLPTPSLADVDGDSDLDLVAGRGGGLVYLENTGTRLSPLFVQRTGFANPFYGGGLPYGATASLADLDDDGDRDVVVGADEGTFSYVETFITQLGPVVAITGLANPLAGQDVGALSAPALADLDRDGDADAVAGEIAGGFAFYENTGTAAAPHFLNRTGVDDPLDGEDVGDEVRPALGDLDGDGDFDLLAGRLTGDFAYFANTGDAEQPLFAAPIANPSGLQDVGSHAAPALGDLDRDGDLDLVAGNYYGAFDYFENTGAATSPAFVRRFGASNPFTVIDVAYYSTPALGDFDSDGDLDLVSGAERGRLFLFENFGTAVAPVFVPPDNPGILAGIDVGDRSSPAGVDLNGDGRPDLVTGATSGTFAVHYFPEPERGVLLAAGIALLSLFDRARRRSPR